MKPTFFLFLILSANISYAQLIDSIPNNNGSVFFYEVVAASNLKKETLYSNSKKFIRTHFGDNAISPDDDDKEAGVVSAKLNSEISIPKRILGSVMDVYFTLQIDSKDGRFRYQISDISYRTKDNYSGVKQPAEYLFDQSVFYKNSGQPKDMNLTCLVKTKELVKLIDELLRKEMIITDDW